MEDGSAESRDAMDKYLQSQFHFDPSSARERKQHGEVVSQCVKSDFYCDTDRVVVGGLVGTGVRPSH